MERDLADPASKIDVNQTTTSTSTHKTQSAIQQPYSSNSSISLLLSIIRSTIAAEIPRVSLDPLPFQSNPHMSSMVDSSLLGTPGSDHSAESDLFWVPEATDSDDFSGSESSSSADTANSDNSAASKSSALPEAKDSEKPAAAGASSLLSSKALIQWYLRTYNSLLAGLPKSPCAPKEANAGLIHPPTVATTSSNAPNALLEPPPTMFFKFAQLPYDIRIRVWELLYVPRVVHISFELDPGFSYNRQFLGRWRILSPRPHPLNFFICRESRHECQQAYTVVKLLDNDRESTLFNYQIDTLFLNVNDFNNYDSNQLVMAPVLRSSPMSHKLEHLAIARRLWFDWSFLFHEAECQHCQWWRGDAHTEFLNSLRSSMCSLKTVKLVVGGSSITRSVKRELYFEKSTFANEKEKEEIVTVRKFFKDHDYYVKVQRVRVREIY